MVPTLAEAFRRAIAKGRNLAPNGMPVTLERIVAIYGNGQIQVSCQAYGPAVIPVTGEGLRTLRAGQKVAVAWEKGRPVTAIAHTAKRSGAPVPLPRPTGGVVEELFADSASRQIWFRNDTIFEPILLFPAEFGIQRPRVRWGKGSAEYFVLIGDNDSLIDVYQLDRPADNEPYPEGQIPVATRVRLYDLFADMHAYGAMTFHFGTAMGTAELRLFSSTQAIGKGNFLGDAGEAIEANVEAGMAARPAFAAIAPNGDLLCTIGVLGNCEVNGFQALSLILTARLGSLVVNVTRQQVLASHLRSLLEPAVLLNEVNLNATCRPLEGGGGWSVTPGGSPEGHVLVLSVALEPGGVPALGNYLLSTLPGVIGTGEEFSTDCYLPPAAVTLRVLGEFAQDVAIVAGGYEQAGGRQVPFVQGSRTHVLWAREPVAGPDIPGLFLTDLSSARTIELLSGPLEVTANLFGIERPDQNVGAITPTGAEVYAVTAGLLLSPREVTGDVTPETPLRTPVFLDPDKQATDEALDARTALDELEEQAALTEIDPVTDAEKLLLLLGLNARGADVQVLNSERLEGLQSESEVL